MTQLVEAPETALTRGVGSFGFDLVQARQQLTDIVEMVSLLREAMKTALVEGEDYGSVGGSKPALMKPGAEKLLKMFALSASITDVREERDGGHLSVRTTVAVRDRRTGTHVADGIGEANTREARYARRWLFASELPEGVDPSKLQSRERQGRNGPYTQYMAPNDDLYTLHNTVLKMSKKRALVDAVLTATHSSGLFAQDLEDHRERPERPAPRPGGGAQRNGRNGAKREQPVRRPNPLTPEETNRFWLEARNVRTPAQVKAALGNRELSECTRAEVLRVWADFGNPPVDPDTGEIADGEPAGEAPDAGDFDDLPFED